ncbi:MAG: SWEET family sugar transporter [Methanobrevibacter sp.]|jgi:uncharacterized protein with PQ loop repeat|nr:SWEET family sugar transporter [Methanobrevibacter sp.]
MNFFYLFIVFISVLLYSSNIIQIWTIYNNKSSKNITPIFTILLFLNCCLWIIYGLQQDEKYVLLANGAGAVVSPVLLYVILRYRVGSKHYHDGLADEKKCGALVDKRK